jgi:hypothetical protein
MGLRLRRTRADRSPRDQVAEILRRDRIERLGGGRQTELGHPQQKLAGFLHPLLDMKRVIHARIVDEALPSDRCARFFKIDAHDEKDRVPDFVGKFF